MEEVTLSNYTIILQEIRQDIAMCVHRLQELVDKGLSLSKEELIRNDDYGGDNIIRVNGVIDFLSESKAEQLDGPNMLPTVQLIGELCRLSNILLKRHAALEKQNPALN